MSKPLTDEQARIMLAALRRQVHRNDVGRWVIHGQDKRPDRRERERLEKRRLLVFESNEDGAFLVPTDRGCALLREHVLSPSPASLSPRAGESRALCADGSSTPPPGCAGPSLQEPGQ